MDMLTRRRLLLLGPLAIVAGAGGAFAALLVRMQEGRYDPHALPSMLVGKPLPAFALPGQTPSEGFTAADVSAQGGPAVVNFFASWCVPCAEEAPALAALRGAGVKLWGIAYKDKPDATARFLDRYGDPYVRIARDEVGYRRHRFRPLWRPGELSRGRRGRGALALGGRAVGRHRAPGPAAPDAGLVMSRLAAALLVLLMLTGGARAVSDPGEMLANPAQERRAEALGDQLRCLVCQNESVEQSDADLAKDLRRIIRGRIAAGATDRQVIGWMVARYGDFIRLNPPFDALTLLLWGAPVIAVATGAGAVLLARRRPPRAPAPLSDAERQRVAELLER